MKSLTAIAMVGAAVALLAPSTAMAADDHGFKQCGSQTRPGAGWYDAEAYKVPCREARAVARKVTRNAGKIGSKHRYRVRTGQGPRWKTWRCSWDWTRSRSSCLLIMCCFPKRERCLRLQSCVCRQARIILSLPGNP